MKILAVNPWIHDFAAYDFWLKPYGFLVLLEYLKENGIRLDYIDCLDAKKTLDRYGRGKYHSCPIKKPEVLASVPRRFKRYGISPAEFNRRVRDKNPDIILVTSSMTYWYTGIKEVIDSLKRRFPRTPVILGGGYATLCRSHAKRLMQGARIIPYGSLRELFSMISVPFEQDRFFDTLPRYEEFYQHLGYIVLRTSWGCPFRCSYCAIGKLYNGFRKVNPSKIIRYIMRYYALGIKDFALYDDAFLYDNNLSEILLEELLRLKIDIRIHTPNALHIAYLTDRRARLLYEAGFSNPHFGLDIIDRRLQKNWTHKLRTVDYRAAAALLRNAGFKEGTFSFYLLLGYPGQDLRVLEDNIRILHECGAKISLAEFSPTPGTKLFKRFKTQLADPLLHNNSIFPFFTSHPLEKIWQIKNYARQLNRQLARTPSRA